MTNSCFIQGLKTIIKNHISYIYDRCHCKNFYQNINKNVCSNNQKKILISYIDSIFNKDIINGITHTNFLEAYVIVKTFIDLEYSVDVIAYDDEYNIKKMLAKKYDIIFGLGKPYELACRYNKDALKIVYLTENAPEYSYNNEVGRIEYYYERHNKKTKITRSGLYFNNEMIRESNYGIFLGNRYNSQNFRNLMPLENLYLLNPTALINRNYKKDNNKNFNNCKKNFLWFGSFGAIHKGLDILLDVFKNNQDINLYIAGLNKSERWLLRDYKDCSNIIDCGFINVKSEKFLKLINKVGFVILPSASEAMSTSVLTCMKHGLIPIVTPNTCINTENIGILLEDYKVDYIKNKLLAAANMNDGLIKQIYDNLLAEVKNKYELKYFENDFSKIIFKILSKEGLK